MCDVLLLLLTVMVVLCVLGSNAAVLMDVLCFMAG